MFLNLIIVTGPYQVNIRLYANHWAKMLLNCISSNQHNISAKISLYLYKILLEALLENEK